MIYDWISMFYNQSIVGKKKLNISTPKLLKSVSMISTCIILLYTECKEMLVQKFSTAIKWLREKKDYMLLPFYLEVLRSQHYDGEAENIFYQFNKYKFWTVCSCLLGKVTINSKPRETEIFTLTLRLCRLFENCCRYRILCPGYELCTSYNLQANVKGHCFFGQ